MSSLNKAILIGRLGMDPEKRFTQGGTSVASFSIATDEKWTDASGEKKEKTTWHNIVTWNKLADIVAQYLRKGQQVYIEGKISIREWDDKDGNKRKSFEIIADKMIMLGSKSGGRAAEEDGERESTSTPFKQEVLDDDIPF